MKHLEILRAELERTFELDELMTFSADILGFSAEQVGGQATLASFAGALIEHCRKEDAIEALADGLRATGHDVSPEVARLASPEPEPDALLSAGDELGPYHIARKLGEGRLGATYLAKRDGKDVRLKVLHPETTRDRRGMQRYLALTRLAGKLEIPALPALFEAGLVGDRYAVVHAYTEGQPLAARVSRTGPMHINEARPLVRALGNALAALHDKHLVHGALSLENIISFRGADGEPDVALLDAGTDRLRIRQSRARTGLSSTGGNPRTVSPEQIRGADADQRSDMYSMGALLFELLSGKPVFDGDVLELAYGHLTGQPPAPSQVAPRGWVTPDIDELVLRLLDKSPDKRPSARNLLEALEDLGRSRRSDDLTDDAIQELEQQLLQDAGDQEAALALESAVGRGASADRIGQAFRLAASMIDDPEQREQKAALLIRAARLLEQKTESLDKAEAVYEELLELRPDDQVALAGLEDVRRRAGKYEELVEMLLARAEQATSARERARAMGQIGRIYLRDLDDHDEAIVAYVQAFCEAPADEYVEGVERAAGTTESRWADALSWVHEAADDPNTAPETRNTLLLQAAAWYRARLSRPDLANPCYDAVLATEPSNEKALVGKTEIYRKAQQWQELGAILTHRADAAPTPAQARELRTESAVVLEQRIGDLPGARAIYEHVLAEDPSHPGAGEGLARILEKLEDYDSLVKLLDTQVEAQAGAEAVRTLCRAGELHEDRLGNLDEAVRCYRAALEGDQESLDALRGLERIFVKQGKYKELIENLERQIQLAATPKQRIGLLERVASVHEEEFLDHEAAADALRRALESDSGRVTAMADLIRHLRVLERWEEASDLYARQLELVENDAERVSLGMAWGRLLADTIGSPERAVQAYEGVLQLNSEHPGALEALAKLRESTGDSDRALEAILALAEQADSAEARAEQYVRAATLCESRGNRDQAIEHYKNALDAQPEDRGISAALRDAYVKRGDINAAVDMLEREFDLVEGERAQAKLAGEMARLQKDKLRDDEKAEHSAKRALRLDGSNLDALLVMGELCFEQERYLEASSHYGRVAERLEGLESEPAIAVLTRYVDALSKSGSTEGALTAMDALLRLAPDDRGALARVAQVTFEHGAPKRAVELIEQFLTKFADDLGDDERALWNYRLGEAERKAGNAKQAVEHLETAAELNPGLQEPLLSLAQAHEALGNYEGVIDAKTRHLDICDDDQRVELLLAIGDVAATQLKDRNQAAKSYVAALEERPDDRRLLTKLMQLYSEEKDWNKLVEIVVKLADFVDEPGQKVKYLQTAALVSARQIGDSAQASRFFEEVLELEPNNEKAIAELVELHSTDGNFNAVEDLLKRQLGMAEDKEDQDGKVRIYDRLGELYDKHLVNPELAAQAYESAHELDPTNSARLDQLAAIYDSDVEAFKIKGVMLQEHLLGQNPFRKEAYKALRRIYTVSRDADASWALCQVLSVLKLAEPDEERFYARMRAETAAPAQEAFSDEDWYERVMHPSLNPLLTAVFGLIEPAVVKARAQSLSQLGVTAEMRVDPSQHESPLAQTLYYAAGVLGVELPAVYANPADTGGLSYLDTETPSLSMGQVGMSQEIPPQVAAFVAARQLAYARPGLYMRHFIQTGTGLKAWLFAAIKLTSPQFPIAADLEGAVNEDLQALRTHLPGDAKDRLSSVVSKLIQSGAALDLKKWVAAVDLSADRAGFIVSHDLETTTQVIQASGDESAAVTAQDRYKEVILYASSSKYFEMRRRLGITVDA